MRIVSGHVTAHIIRDYAILTESEWRSAGLGNIGYWRTVWGLRKDVSYDLDGFVTSDGYVIPVKSWLYNYGVIVGANTIIGSVYFRTHEMTLDKWGEKTEYSKNKDKRAYASDVLFSKEYLSTGDLIYATRAAYGERPSNSILKKLGEKKLKSRRVQNLMKKEVEEAAERVGVDRDFVLLRLKEISSGDTKQSVIALKELVDILELKPAKQLSGGGIHVSLPLSEDDIKALEEAKRHKLAEVVPAEVVE